MTKVFEYRARNHTEKLVLLALADNANDEGECWPSLATIEGKCQLTRPGLLNVIKRLDETGLVKRTSGGGRFVNHYQFDARFLPEKQQQSASPAPVNAVDCTGKRRLPHRVTAFTAPVNAVYPNHQRIVKESSREETARAREALPIPVETIRATGGPPEAVGASVVAMGVDSLVPVARSQGGSARCNGHGNGKVPRYPDGVRETVAQFGSAFGQQFGRPYGAGAADLRAASAILAMGVTPADVVDLARRAWSVNGFWGKSATSLKRLAANWNEVQAELVQRNRPTCVGETGHGISAEKWAEEMLENSKEGA